MFLTIIIVWCLIGFIGFIYGINEKTKHNINYFLIVFMFFVPIIPVIAKLLNIM